MDEKALNIVKGLVEKFGRNYSEYKKQDYKEDWLRQEFINPFFDALGWDISNKSGAAPAYRDVIHEDSIKMTGAGTKAPDYCFTLSGRRMFFVETKKPAVSIVNDANPAYQLRRYAWSAKLPLSILTNFEDLCIYESRQKPHVGDKSNVERVKHIKFTEYIYKWDEIASVFSYDSVKQGSFDRFAQSMEKKRGTQEVGQEFLKEIEDWRENLAKNIALRNPNLEVRELNFCVQKTIDRIIFLRMCEDRGIETYSELRTIAERDHIYENLCKVFEKADDKYNSGLFHFRKEKGRNTLPDELTLNLSIDDPVLKNIFRHLYYPNCPYEFSVLPPEILGNVYEQFLGKIIRLTEGHRAKVEEKPEVKKAGGVYYTPQYIVEYIVRNTVKKLCEGKTPKQISDIKILDPACGSGSFLLGAYSYLLQYHLDYYASQKNVKRFKEEVYQSKDGQLFLTIKEKKRILLNNIFGVDIDNQAVEVTKLSLLLKVLEGASKDIFEQQQKLWIERALPDLDNNIKCGNSLIAPDFYDSDQTKLVEDNEKLYHINAFDWKTEYKEIMDDGGFDLVIGNPPYVKLHNMDKESLGYFFKHYQTAEKKCDIYAFFTEHVLNYLLREKGLLGYIISDTWLNLDSFTNLRRIVTKENTLIQITQLDNPFFKVTVSPIIFFVEKGFTDKYKFSSFQFDIKDKKILSEKKISSQTIEPPNYIIDLTVTKESSELVHKINQRSISLESIANLQYGIMTADNERFVLLTPKTKHCKPLLSGEDIRRYHSNWLGNRYVDYRPDEMKIKKTARPGEPERFEQNEKIVFQRYSSTKLIAALDTSKFYTLGTTIIAHSTSQYSNKYILGLINSKLLSWWYGRTFTSPTNYIREFEILPICRIDFSDSSSETHHNRVIVLVDRIIDLHKRLTKANADSEKLIIQRQIDATDQQIDNLVYELYGLTKEEIAIVEESLR